MIPFDDWLVFHDLFHLGNRLELRIAHILVSALLFPAEERGVETVVIEAAVAGTAAVTDCGRRVVVVRDCHCDAVRGRCDWGFS